MPNEALDFHGNLLSFLFRCDKLLCAKVDFDGSFLYLDTQGIICDGPTVFFERISD